jgi:hypothetical protein
MLRCALVTVIAIVVLTGPSRAVILYGTDDFNVNTTAPTGPLANSGWQYEGQFGSFLGTAIASNYFVTAKHIGGSVGQTFTLNGTNYTTTAVFPDPSSDLQVWQVAGTFPIQAPLYSSAPGSEVNLNLVVFGRGTRRGSSVLVGNDSHLGGWLWGASDELERWGTNVVESIYTDPSFGRLVRAAFDNNAGPNEAHLSSGDSGGAVFVFNSTTNRWELAGINLGVDGPFSTSSDGANAFNAAMFDTTGLVVPGDNGTWVAAPNPSAFYSTEIAAHRRFIESIVMQLTNVVSRKIHGNAGTFDVTLPSSGSPGIECRFGGATNSYTLVFTFTNNISVQNATITAGTGSVTNFTVVGNVVTVALTGVTSVQTITVTLNSVSDGTNTSDVEAAMSVLVGDTNADRFVDAVDVSQTKSQSGNGLTAANYREDTNVDGFIDAVDVSLVKSKSGSALPASPKSATPQSTNINPLPVPNREMDRTRSLKWNKLQKNR